MSNTRVLFLCRERVYGVSYGLFFSATFVSEVLRLKGIQSKVVIVIDGNGIDKEVHEYNPTHVIIEAIWVTPVKLRELAVLYPRVKWIVRIHSEIPFLAHEGMGFEWAFEYQRISNAWVASNSKNMAGDLRKLGICSIYLPNIYLPAFTHKDSLEPICSPGVINIGCFGAIRPLKNQLEQAAAAIVFANQKHKVLKFHINSSRTEQNSGTILKNIRALFNNSNPHKLVEHDWMGHEDFLVWVRRMDLGLQVSFSETFNIVTADFVDSGIPIVVSNEMSWMPFWTKAETTNIDDMVKIMSLCYAGSKINLQYINRLYLGCYNSISVRSWLKYLKNHAIP